MRLPKSVRVRNPHLQDATVAIDVLDRQALDRVLIVRVGAGARAHVLRLVGERPFGAIGVHARTEVEHARVERAGDLRILAVALDQVLQEIDAGDRRRDFGRVDVAVDPERGFVQRIARRAVRDGDDPDVPVLVTAADRLDADELRVLGGECTKQLGELLVAIEAVELDARHRAGARGKARSVAAAPRFSQPAGPPKQPRRAAARASIR